MIRQHPYSMPSPIGKGPDMITNHKTHNGSPRTPNHPAHSDHSHVFCRASSWPSLKVRFLLSPLAPQREIFCRVGKSEALPTRPWGFEVRVGKKKTLPTLHLNSRFQDLSLQY
jgi:hypothetical protein